MRQLRGIAALGALLAGFWTPVAGRARERAPVEGANPVHLVVHLSERKLYLYDGDHLVNTYGVAVGAKLYFQEPDYYIHGTDATETLGSAASHGCLRMDPADVERLARYVQEHGGAGRSEAWYARAEKDDATKHEVDLPSPVPVEIDR